MKELPISIDNFIPCRTCTNILTEECLDDCINDGEFNHYRQVPGTDIVDLPTFPLQDILNRNLPRHRLVAICVYLASVVDYLQHIEEYQKNREYYKRNGIMPEDYSI